MKPAGEVTSHIGQRLLIVKSDAGQLPPLYAKVAASNEKPVGKIVDLYGSVAHPYLTVLCESDPAGISVGDMLYVIPEEKSDRSGKFRKDRRNKRWQKQK
ncbi:MAG TPA: H/ACA ribonucleoprotein complex subunit GAR1 [Methanocorpusculum sp.]|nr:H/ACA ribonucleoprotein complex subunit GAR1 [Methanocorpusculum sp.]